MQLILILVDFESRNIVPGILFSYHWWFVNYIHRRKGQEGNRRGKICPRVHWPQRTWCICFDNVKLFCNFKKLTKGIFRLKYFPFRNQLVMWYGHIIIPCNSKHTNSSLNITISSSYRYPMESTPPKLASIFHFRIKLTCLINSN